MGNRKKYKGYIILGYNEDEQRYVGYTENSFSMGVSNCRVKVFSEIKGGTLNWDKHGFKSPNEMLWVHCRYTAERLNRNGYYGNTLWKVYRIGSKHCPVKVDMSDLMKHIDRKITLEKYCIRNHRFVDKFAENRILPNELK
jgi:hypothetical protein